MNLSTCVTSSAIWMLASFVGIAVAAEAPKKGTSPAVSTSSSAFKLPTLPFARDALEPHVSARTIDLHYGKHHQGYVDKLNKLTVGTDMAGRQIEEILRTTVGQAEKADLFNNAAQVWNHTFFWKSMKPKGGGAPDLRLAEVITASFGSLDSFKTAFSDSAMAQFGSGWVWLVQEGNVLKIVKTSNADTPIAHGQTPLLTCDIWEHAYYLDYQNRRKDFVQVFLNNLVNWEFAASQLK